MARKATVRRAVAKADADGPMTRVVHDVAGAAEALTVGAVHLARSTLTAAVETVEDVGSRIGSLAVTTVLGAAKAVSDVGGGLGELVKRPVQAVAGTVTGARMALADDGSTARRPLARVPSRGRRPLARAGRSTHSTQARKASKTA